MCVFVRQKSASSSSSFLKVWLYVTVLTGVAPLNVFRNAQGSQPLMADQQIGCLVWSPLAGGYMAGKYTPGGEAQAPGRRAGFDFPPIDKDQADRIVLAMRPIAAAHGVSVAQIALAWLLAKPVVTSVIIGARTDAQLADNLASVKVKLSSEELATLDAVSALPQEYPGWMVEWQNGRDVNADGSKRSA
jgi:aryl-alcohol dehydrogenase-like predicted oxidoreductase